MSDSFTRWNDYDILISFLTILTYNAIKGELIFNSKSKLASIMAQKMKDLFPSCVQVHVVGTLKLNNR
jgi:hypothetical protein